jgi:hypothetical protein
MNHKAKLKMLEPWAGVLSELYADLDRHCRDLSDEDLAAFTAATTGMTQTNCWWAAYHVAPIVREAAQMEAQRRRQRAERHSRT